MDGEPRRRRDKGKGKRIEDLEAEFEDVELKELDSSNP